MLIPNIAWMSKADREEFNIWADACAGIAADEIPDLSLDQQEKLYEDYEKSLQYAIDYSG